MYTVYIYLFTYIYLPNYAYLFGCWAREYIE